MISVPEYHLFEGYYPDEEPDLTSEETDYEQIEDEEIYDD